MSLKVMDRVWQLAPSAIAPTERYVLVALAWYANDSGWSVFPSVATLVRRTSLARRTVQKALRRLADPGSFLTVAGTGSRGVIRYALNLAALEPGVSDREPRSQSSGRDRAPRSQSPRPDRAPRTPSKRRDRVPRAQKCESGSQKCESGSQICEPRSPDPYVIRTDPSVIRTPARTRRLTETALDGFNTFWQHYPRKEGKGAAWQAWQKRRPPLDQVLEALAWQRQTDQWLRESGRFIPHPSTWINQSRWQDEPNNVPRLNDKTVALARSAAEFLKS